MLLPLSNKVHITNLNEVWVFQRSVQAMKPMLKNPRQILDVRYPENVGILGIEFGQD
jgi:hypothetical protein